MPVEFTQDFSPSEKIRGDRFGTDTIKVVPVARVNDLKYKSKYWLAKKKDREKADLMREVNKLIDEFNDLNTGLSKYGNVHSDSTSQFSIANTINRYFKSKGLDNHIQYLTQYAWEIHYNVARTLERLCYIRTKEFEGFLKSLEGKKSDVILREICKFKNDKFDSWKKDVQLATVKNVDFMLKQIIKKYLKPKQESRKKQLAEKFEEWKRKLSKPKNGLEKNFASLLDHLIKILSGKSTQPLTHSEIEVLKACFKGDRSWEIASHGALTKKYKPFPKLNLNTNRVFIGLFGMITDKDGKAIDPQIEQYLSGANSFQKIPKQKPAKKTTKKSSRR